MSGLNQANRVDPVDPIVTAMWQERCRKGMMACVCCNVCGGGYASTCECARQRFVRSVKPKDIQAFKEEQTRREVPDLKLQETRALQDLERLHHRLRELKQACAKSVAATVAPSAPAAPSPARTNVATELQHNDWIGRFVAIYSVYADQGSPFYMNLSQFRADVRPWKAQCEEAAQRNDADAVLALAYSQSFAELM